MNWFELAIEDRRLLVQQASTVSGINAKALEKDLWQGSCLYGVNYSVKNAARQPSAPYKFFFIHSVGVMLYSSLKAV